MRCVALFSLKEVIPLNTRVKAFGRDTRNARFGNESEGSDKREILFPNRSVFSLNGHVEGVTITCITGSVWITQEGDTRDHVLSSGELFAACRGGQIIVQIIENARITIRNLKKNVPYLRHPEGVVSFPCGGAASAPSTWNIVVSGQSTAHGTYGLRFVYSSIGIRGAGTFDPTNYFAVLPGSRWREKASNLFRSLCRITPWTKGSLSTGRKSICP